MMTASSVSRFWDNYIEKTRAYKLKPGVERCYVKHVESYISFHQGVKLSTHEPGHIEKYFTYKSRNPQIKDRQFVQIAFLLWVSYLFVRFSLGARLTAARPST